MFNFLEEDMEVILANARHIKNVLGRNTDVKGCEWIAQLLCQCHIADSVIPPAPIRELRDLIRFPSDSYLSAWAGVSAGNNESAGKRKSGKSTTGNRLLKGILT